MLRGREEAECEELTVSWVQRLRPAVPRQAVIQIYNHRAAALLTRTQTRPPQTTLDTGYSLTATCDEHDASTHKTRNFKDCNHIKPWYFSCFLTISTFRVFGSPTSDGMLLPLIINTALYYKNTPGITLGAKTETSEDRAYSNTKEMPGCSV